MFKKFIAEVKARKVRKWLAIHISTSLTVFGAVNLIGNRYNFPPVIFDIIFIISLCSLPMVLALAWYHTSEMKRKFKPVEIIFYTGMIGVMGYFLAGRIFGSEEKPVIVIASSIAVLPFQNFSDSKDERYFSDGITEDILNHLSKIKELKVVSRTSVMRYRDSEKSIREIAQELGVETILEGSVRRSGDRIRIVSQLIDAKNDVHLWSETYDRDLADIFDIQSEVAQKIAAALRVRLSENEKERIEKKYSRNTEAYTYYLQGRDYYTRLTENDMETAISLFKKAISLDSTFTEAYAYLSMSYSQNFRVFMKGPEWSDSARILSEKAIQLDPDIVEPYIASGMYFLYNGKNRVALEQAYKAVNVNPNSKAVGDIGQLNYLIGNYREAIPWLEKAVSIDPVNWTWYRVLGQVKSRLFKFDQAETLFLKVLDLMPNNIFVIRDLTELYIVTDRFEKADSMLRNWEKKHPEDYRIMANTGQLKIFRKDYVNAFPYIKKAIDIIGIDDGPGVEYAFLLMQTGEKSEANKVLEKVIMNNKKAIEGGIENYNYPYELARVYSIIKNKNESLHYLQMAIEYGWGAFLLTSADPLLENIRNEPEFKKIMAALKKDLDRMALVID